MPANPAGSGYADWEKGLRQRLHQLRINSESPHDTIRGWIKLLEERAGFKATVATISRYEAGETIAQSASIPARYVHAVAVATGTDPRWILGWTLAPDASPTIGLQEYRYEPGKPRLRERGRYLDTGEKERR